MLLPVLEMCFGWRPWAPFTKGNLRGGSPNWTGEAHELEWMGLMVNLSSVPSWHFRDKLWHGKGQSSCETSAWTWCSWTLVPACRNCFALIWSSEWSWRINCTNQGVLRPGKPEVSACHALSNPPERARVPLWEWILLSQIVTFAASLLFWQAPHHVWCSPLCKAQSLPLSILLNVSEG